MLTDSASTTNQNWPRTCPHCLPTRKLITRDSLIAHTLEIAKRKVAIFPCTALCVGCAPELRLSSCCYSLLTGSKINKHCRLDHRSSFYTEMQILYSITKISTILDYTNLRLLTCTSLVYLSILLL